MPVRERLPKGRLDEPLAFSARRWLIGGRRSAWFYLTFRGSEQAQRKFWRQHSDMVVHWHVRHWPGSRPRLWWRYDSPEPRRRLSGIGDSLNDLRAQAPVYEYGLPVGWRRRGVNDYLSRGVPVDDRNPPVFESSAVYLRRHKLLLPGEARRLRGADYEPLVIT